MKVLTWNINGIRSLPSKLKDTLNSLDADIICFQETKITRDALDSEIALVDNFNAYFSFSRKRSGYSGVATFCKQSGTPAAAEEGLTPAYSNNAWTSTLIGCYSDAAAENYSKDQLKSLDGEGRVIITKHLFKIKNSNFYLHIVNVYCPRFDPDKLERKQFKSNFYNLLKFRVDEILRKSPENHVIIVGDLNCSHQRIDHCDPDEDPEFEENESRQWLTRFLWNPAANPDGKFVDVFRQFYPFEKNAFTCWNTKISARETNYGTRIDYILMDAELFRRDLIKNIRHCTDVHGSDHCPVVVELDIEIIPPQRFPDLCSKFMPEFRGVQQKLTSFIVKRSSSVEGQGKEEKIVTNKKVKLEKKTTTLLNFWSNAKAKESAASAPARCDSISEDTSSSSSSGQSSQTSDASKEKWKSIFAPTVKKPAPICGGHGEPCILRTVKKQGPNLNRQFYCCSRPQGTKDNKNARCNHFEWNS